jgi:predicted RNA-binding protein
MEPDDRILFYVAGKVRKWTAIVTVTSKYFEDRTPIWESNGSRRELYPYRVKTTPSIVLDEGDYIEALILAPRLEYVKRWPPELWPLAFFDTLHLIPQRDYRLIETEMRRIGRQKRSRGGRRDYLNRRDEGPSPLEGTHTNSSVEATESSGAEQSGDPILEETPAEDQSSSG